MLGEAELVAFVTATDPRRAARFYGEVLGLTLRDRSEFALEFSAANARLRVAIAAHGDTSSRCGRKRDELSRYLPGGRHSWTSLDTPRERQ